jgi:hypothetical protein
MPAAHTTILASYSSLFPFFVGGLLENYRLSQLRLVVIVLPFDLLNTLVPALH